ncbi:hypothetical protein DY78_GL000998 [Lactiplantibacillus fabifermentans DSM 21115]|uniref:Uncharacterized protein n=2 Tax=Lactiplantibacillus fabifermentans TaxID=483011 RepID=A0A0R2NNW1_9LACO|nr:hypothetical protein DY78_GL000998 [Lactiplantibacillus fabifermentans DSM 21115]
MNPGFLCFTATDTIIIIETGIAVILALSSNKVGELLMEKAEKMDLRLFTREDMLLSVINQLAEKAALASTELVLLNWDFSAKETQKLMKFLMKKQLTKAGLSKRDFRKKVKKIKPDIVSVKVFTNQLKVAFDAEGRFPDLLND